MKHIITMIIVIILFSCKSNQLSPKNSFVSISKNPCLKNCEVSDLHIYKDGSFVYNGVLNTKIKGTHKGMISANKLIEIREALNQLSKDIPKIKGRDLPSITIKHKSFNTTYQYNHKELKNIKVLIEEIINSIP